MNINRSSAAVLTICALTLAGCGSNTPAASGTTAAQTTTTAEQTTTAPQTTTSATSGQTTTAAQAVNDSALEVYPVEHIKLAAETDEAAFPDQTGLAAAKELFYEKFLRDCDDGNAYAAGYVDDPQFSADPGYVKIEGAEDTWLRSWWSCDFDRDGSDEYIVMLEYTHISTMECTDKGTYIIEDGTVRPLAMRMTSSDRDDVPSMLAVTSLDVFDFGAAVCLCVPTYSGSRFVRYGSDGSLTWITGTKGEVNSDDLGRVDLSSFAAGTVYAVCTKDGEIKLIGEEESQDLVLLP